MARYQAKQREDGSGPYRWAHIIKTPRGTFARGTIYQQMGTNLTAEDAQALRALCDANGFDLRRVA